MSAEPELENTWTRPLTETLLFGSKCSELPCRLLPT